MRTVPIITIISKYGINSRRLSKKYPVKYEDAIQAIKEYQNSDLKIVDVIDNKLYPSKSVSDHCQIKGCGKAIRYEYVLENKTSGERIVAGSTCVWPTLGFSKLQKKEFIGFENVIKEHHEMLLWKKDHMDIVYKLNRLQSERFTFYRPFWEEIEHSRLTEEDEKYIESVDVDKLIEEREEKKRRAAERKAARVAYLNANDAQKAQMDADYNKVIEALQSLLNDNPKNYFYKSLMDQHNRGWKLSPRQINSVKKNVNKNWYYKKIKGTKNDIMQEVDSILGNVFNALGIQPVKEEDSKDVLDKVSNAVNSDAKSKMAWALYRVKYGIVM